MAKKCAANNRNGKKCGAWVLTCETKCPLHLDPKRAAKLGAKHGRETVLPGDDDLAPMEPPKTARDVRDALAHTMAQVHDRKMEARTANALAYVATSLLRAIEVSDLYNRLMTLEERREQSELSASLHALRESRRDTVILDQFGGPVSGINHPRFLGWPT